VCLADGHPDPVDAHRRRARATQPLAITQQRCDELLSAMPTDPWPARREASVLAWTESTVVASLLDLYLATRDRKYLDELVRRGDQILSHRDDARGFKAYSGRAQKRWSIATKYTAARATLADAGGRPLIEARSMPLTTNHVTRLVVTSEVGGGGGGAGGFTIRASKRDETFANLSADPKSDRARSRSAYGWRRSARRWRSTRGFCSRIGSCAIGIWSVSTASRCCWKGRGSTK
jgi:hypothetical protein